MIFMLDLGYVKGYLISLYMLNSNVVIFENVGLRYKLSKEVLRDINLTLKEADFILLSGESGAGKSSFLNLLNLSIFPSRGFLSILGKDVQNISSKDMSNLRRQIGIVFQDFRLINHLNVFDNIALPLKILGLQKEEITEKVVAVLKWIGLDDYWNSFPSSMSGGEQQRIAIARAIINQPKILLADEPTGSIDSKMANKVIDMLEELNEEGLTIIFATHNQELLNRKKHKLITIKNTKLFVENESNK